MAVPRALFITFSILYLVMLAVVLWFLLYYSGVPAWVWIFFGIAILLIGISLIIDEVTRKHKRSGSLNSWGALHIILQLCALVLMIVGLVFVIKYSTIPWWIWLILGLGILFILIGSLISSVGGKLPSIILTIIGFVAYLVGFVLLVIYSESPWWIWILIGLLFVFSILSSIFDHTSGTEKSKSTKSNPKPDPDQETQTENYPLPSSNIPEQVIEF